MNDTQRIAFEEKYLELLLDKLNEGIRVFETISIVDATFKDLVVNINNTNNIILQLQDDIKRLSSPKTTEDAPVDNNE